MSLGKGSVYSSSTRQKLNTKSSTEAELVGVSNAMSQILWTWYFMEAQGYGIDENIVGQDNMSTMLLENNGRASSGRRTRHINIRYFFVTDRIKSKEMSVVHCPTGEMVADYFTKPLQGAIYLKFRDLIMNVSKIDPSTDSCKDQRSVLGVGEESNQDSNDHTVGLEDGEIYEPGGPPIQGRPNMRVVSDEADTHKKNMPVDSTAKGLIEGYRNMDEKVGWSQPRLAPK
jgi:hypothetical protein